MILESIPNPRLTPLQAWEHVRAHLLEQGHQSYSPELGCTYRGRVGCACAIGCLIPDELYDPEFEGLGIQQPVVLEVIEQIVEFPPEGVKLHNLFSPEVYIAAVPWLHLLQRVHDRFPAAEKLRVPWDTWVTIQMELLKPV